MASEIEALRSLAAMLRAVDEDDSLGSYSLNGVRAQLREVNRLQSEATKVCAGCGGPLDTESYYAHPPSGAVFCKPACCRLSATVRSSEAKPLVTVDEDGIGHTTDGRYSIGRVWGKKLIDDAVAILLPWCDIDHSEECSARHCDEGDCNCPDREDPTGTGERDTIHEDECTCTVGAIQRALDVLQRSTSPTKEGG